MPYENILYDKAGPVATITLNRPEALNAITPDMTAELHQALDAADADAEVRAQPEVRHISNTTFLFAALAGWKAAHRYGLTGDHFDAAEAERIGIVNEVVPAAELMTRARALAERIARVPEPSVRLNKAVTCYGLLAMGVGAGMMMNIPLSALAHSSFNAERAELLDVMKSGGT